MNQFLTIKNLLKNILFNRTKTKGGMNMKTIWQGTDAFLLNRMPKELSLREKYYTIKTRIFARLVDKFSTEHYACGPLVAEDLKKFGMKKPIKYFQDFYNEYRFVKLSHEGFNVLYYFPKRNRFREWLYGWDIFEKVKEHFPQINFIVVDGSHDMSKIYPIVDFMIRPCRNDGLPRMVKECEVNNIPYLWTRQNPEADKFIKAIENEFNSTITGI
jgi:hypothetical protein